MSIPSFDNIAAFILNPIEIESKGGSNFQGRLILDIKDS